MVFPRQASKGESMTQFKAFRSAVCAALCLLGIGIAPFANALSCTFTDLGTLGGTNGFNPRGSHHAVRSQTIEKKMSVTSSVRTISIGC